MEMISPPLSEWNTTRELLNMLRVRSAATTRPTFEWRVVSSD